ncbi:phage baseplate assembly protein V [Paenibacillus sp. FJAT-26967]|uniref:phage baseplate assembly protein V n=1 Tax=Paenibacillus sp. FJAT-26967 TaxID=1729690 RepID=UPI000837EE6A|nr:phage baseplate assembly protein V [Paenibacillus sp. FJAT-26967]
MSPSIYTFTDISVAPYKFERITDLKLVKEVNEHTKLTISGIVPEDMLDRYVEQADENEHIAVSVQDEGRTLVIFQGIVTNMAVQAVQNVRTITIEAQSSTLLMDIKKKTRSFQNSQQTYNGLFDRITGSYANSDVVVEASGGTSVGGLLVQYKETDWEFARRLASRLHMPLLPLSSQKGMKCYVGVPDLGEPYKLDEFNYSIRKDLKDYKRKSENGISGLDEQDSISYEVSSGKILELGSPVNFQRRKLYVYRAQTQMEGGILVSRYVLRDKQGFSCPTIYAYALAGTSLFGSIRDVSKDKVKVRLQIDGASSESMWFPYSTVYSSPDGSGWYCMPEVGDEVRLYFPDEQEKNAFAASSVDTDSSDPQKRSDPSVKSISTKYGKQIVFKPGSVEIIGGGNLLMRLTDDGGIEINSHKKIAISAAEDIEITGGAKVIIQGDEGIDLVQAAARLIIQDEVKITGGKVNIE